MAELEEQRKEAQAKMKVAPRHITQDVDVQDKQHSKFEGKRMKEGNFTWSLSKQSKESMTKYIAVMMEALDSLTLSAELTVCNQLSLG